VGTTVSLFFFSFWTVWLCHASYGTWIVSSEKL